MPEEAHGGRRVVVVHPSAELYGSDRVAAESSAALVDAGWTVSATLTAEGPLRRMLEDGGAAVTVIPAPVLRKSLLSPLGLLWFVADSVRRTPAMVRLLRRTAADVVYVSTVTVPWWLVVARLSGARVVCHVHEAEDTVPRVVRFGLAAPLLLAHRVVANSDVSRDVVVGSVPRLRSRTAVVYNGVPGPAEPAPLREVLTGPVRLVLIGRVSPRKGTDVAVEALDLLRARGLDVTLDLVGGVFPGYEWYSAQVEAQVAAADLGDRVRWRGVLPEIWGSLAGADIALVPSRAEPFGNAAVEAMLAGRPVVAAAVQGLREIVRDRENGELAAPGDATGLADAVQRLVEDWPAARVRAAAARAEALSRFSTERYRAELVRVVSEVNGAR